MGESQPTLEMAPWRDIHNRERLTLRVEMGTEMGSGSWKEMQMETQMGTEMMASEAVASRTANRSVCTPQRPPHRTPSTHGMAPSLRAATPAEADLLRPPRRRRDRRRMARA